MNNIVLAYFQTKHKETLNVPYMPSWGKDNKILSDVVSVYGMDKTKDMIDRYFESLRIDPFLKKTGASVGIFKSQLPKLVLDMAERKEKSDNKRGVL